MPLTVDVKGTVSQEVIAAQAQGLPWPQRYRVVRVTGDTVPKIGTYLSEDDIRTIYMDRTDWRVEIS